MNSPQRSLPRGSGSHCPRRWSKSPLVQVVVGLPVVIAVSLWEGFDDVVLGHANTDGPRDRARDGRDGAGSGDRSPVDVVRRRRRSHVPALSVARVGRIAFALGQLAAVTIGLWGVVCVILALADQAGRVTR